MTFRRLDSFCLPFPLPLAALAVVLGVLGAAVDEAAAADDVEASPAAARLMPDTDELEEKSCKAASTLEAASELGLGGMVSE